MKTIAIICDSCTQEIDKFQVTLTIYHPEHLSDKDICSRCAELFTLADLINRLKVKHDLPRA